jgi:hypothetical protein
MRARSVVSGTQGHKIIYKLSFILIFNALNYKRVPFMSQVVRRRHSADFARRPLDPEGWRINAFAVQAVASRSDLWAGGKRQLALR